MEKKAFFSAKRITGLAALLALVIVLQAALGSITIGVSVQLNFSLIPIVLGAILYGAIGGGILGFACGVVVTIQVMMGGSLFYTILWTYTPVMTTLTCLIKTTAAGIVGGLLFRAISKKNVRVALFTTAGIVPVVNTVLFILGCLCMNESITAYQSRLPEYFGMNTFTFILVVLVTFNFFIELAIDMLVSPALYRVIGIVDKKYKRKNV